MTCDDRFIGAAFGLAGWLAVTAAPASGPPVIAGARLESVSYSALDGWQDDDHAAAFAAFRLSCRAIVEAAPELRLAQPAPPALVAACREGLALDSQDAAAARQFFETRFQPWRVRADGGASLLTGYFEPEVAGAMTPGQDFKAPVLGRPPDLVTLQPGNFDEALPPGLTSARRTSAGLEPFPDRSAILDGALAGQGLERLYLKDAVEVFIVQVQGSARVRLADGRQLRLTYAGRNGHPYTSIGRALIAQGSIAPAEMSLERLTSWLRANPEAGDRIMRLNRSYVFFEVSEVDDPARGPIGGAGIALTAGRSLAVDRNLWPYGVPIFIGADLDTLAPPLDRQRRLMIAQDTGSAIVGPARADFFWGSGNEAGRRAGWTRHPLDFVVLWTRS